jgi:6-phosphofructokinase
MRKTTKILSGLPLSMPRLEFKNPRAHIIMKSFKKRFKIELLIYLSGNGSEHMAKMLNKA